MLECENARMIECGMTEWLQREEQIDYDRMVRCNFDMTEWCVAILIKIYQNNEGTEQNFARLLQMLIRTKIKLCEASANAHQNQNQTLRGYFKCQSEPIPKPYEANTNVFLND